MAKSTESKTKKPSPTQPVSFRIRAMKESDVGPVCDLAKQLGYDLNDGQFFGRFSVVSRASGNSLWMMESSDGHAVGFMHLERVDRLIVAPRVEIHALVVDEKFRGQGLGKRFVLYAESYTRGEGLSQIYVTSNQTRIDTHAFYEKRGYRKIKTSYTFTKEV